MYCPNCGSKLDYVTSFGFDLDICQCPNCKKTYSVSETDGLLEIHETELKEDE